MTSLCENIKLLKYLDLFPYVVIKTSQFKIQWSLIYSTDTNIIMCIKLLWKDMFSLIKTRIIHIFVLFCNIVVSYDMLPRLLYLSSAVQYIFEKLWELFSALLTQKWFFSITFWNFRCNSKDAFLQDFLVILHNY